MKVTSGADFAGKMSSEDFQRYASRLLTDLVNAFNGKIEFDVNIAADIVTANFTTANADLSISHTLKRTGLRYFPIKKSAACDIYDGTGGSTANTIVLRGTAAANVTLLLF